MPLKEFITKCHNNLVDENSEKEVVIAKEYLHSRKLLEKSVIYGNIGYCKGNETLPDAIRSFGKEFRKDEDYWDLSYFIKGRIIIPVYSEFNTAVGLATRKPTHESGNTWWNLPLPFKKGNHLFLLNVAKRAMFERNKVYVVEGYMDALILRQYGLENVVGLMGTALSLRKIGLISRYCNNVCLCLDSDANQAGQKATETAIFNLKKFDFCENISVIRGLPEGEDPDEYVVRNGLDALLQNEVILENSEIEKVCRKVAKQSKEMVYAQ